MGELRVAWMIPPQASKLEKEIDITGFRGQRGVLGQDDDAREPLAMSENLLQGRPSVPDLGFQGLKRIGAVGQMDRCRRHVKPLEVRHVFKEHFHEIPLRCSLTRLIGEGVAVFAPVSAAHVDVDTISVPARKSVLMGERAIPLDDSWPGGAQDRFARCVGQKVPGKRCLLLRGFSGPDRSISFVDPINEVFDRTDLVLEESIHAFPQSADTSHCDDIVTMPTFANPAVYPDSSNAAQKLDKSAGRGRIPAHGTSSFPVECGRRENR